MPNQPPWDRIWELFEQALTRPVAERSHWLEEHCPTEGELRSRVEQLLNANDRATGLLDRPIPDLAAAALDEASNAAASNERVGPYTIISEIGRGGMGIVYKAEDPRLDRFVALKFLPQHLTASDEAKKRLLAEARAASGLDHPNICTIHDVGETDDGRLFFAMAFYHGETLDRQITNGALRVEEAIRIARLVTAGLGCAHEAGIIHRDIKPSNILVTDHGEVKILDFGLARQTMGSHSETGTRAGTVAYMSPEQATGASLDHRTDLWSLGVTLFEMLTGHKPFAGDTDVSFLYNIVHTVPNALPASVPRQLADIVNRLLAKEPRDRFASARELIERLDAVGSGAESSAAAEPRRILPNYLTSFIGRENEIEETRRLLATTRLLTLTGPGGTGKTRLSLELARIVEPDFLDGICFVPLAPISDPALVASAIAKALGVVENPGTPVLDQLIHSLGSRQILLVIDNFEHVAEAAPLLTQLLHACRNVKAVVSSRAILQVAGEQEFPVPALDLPRRGERTNVERLGRHSAIRLFVERARAAKPSFEFDEDNAKYVAEICVRLDGLPLAIELAAARVRLFAPKALLDRLVERIDLLKGGGRDLPARHRTLSQAIAWSYDLLEDHAKRLFQRLSVFAGGWTLEAAEAICSREADPECDIFDLLCVLADQSLIRDSEGPDGEPRFWMLETIRAFARQELVKSGEETVVLEAHASYFVDLAERAEPSLTRADQGNWLNRLEREHDNMRAVFAWVGRNRDPIAGIRLAAALWRFWIGRGYIDEGIAYMKSLKNRSFEEVDSEARRRALNGFGTLQQYRGDYLSARDTFQECLNLARSREDRHGGAVALNNLSWVRCWTSELDAASELAEEALAIHTECGDRRGAAVALNNLGWVANFVGRYRAAISYHERSLEIRREIEDLRGIGFALSNLAWAEQYHGRYQVANRLLDEAEEVLRPLQDTILTGWLLINRGRVARDEGDFDRAVAELERGLSVWPSGGNRTILAMTKTLLGSVLHSRAETDSARRRIEEALTLWNDIRCPWGIAVNRLEAARIMIEPDETAAEALLRETLEMFGRIGCRIPVAECLEELAMISHRQDNRERAGSLVSIAKQLREEVEAPVPPGRAARLREIQPAEVGEVSIAAAVAAGAGGS